MAALSPTAVNETPPRSPLSSPLPEPGTLHVVDQDVLVGIVPVDARGRSRQHLCMVIDAKRQNYQCGAAGEIIGNDSCSSVQVPG